MGERRKFPRVELVSAVRIQPADPKIPQLIAWGSDLSEGGIGVETNGPLSVREGAALQITVPGSRISILAKGKVIWKESSPGLRAGIQFHPLETLARAQIRHLLSDQMNQRVRRFSAHKVFGPGSKPIHRIRWRVPLSVVAIWLGGMLLFWVNDLDRSIQALQETTMHLRVEKIRLESSVVDLKRETAILAAFQEAKRKTDEEQ